MSKELVATYQALEDWRIAHRYLSEGGSTPEEVLVRAVRLQELLAAARIAQNPIEVTPEEEAEITRQANEHRNAEADDWEEFDPRLDIDI